MLRRITVSAPGACYAVAAGFKPGNNFRGADVGIIFVSEYIFIGVNPKRGEKCIEVFSSVGEQNIVIAFFEYIAVKS